MISFLYAPHCRLRSLILHRATWSKQEKKEKRKRNTISVRSWEGKDPSVNNYLLSWHYVWSTGIDSAGGNRKQKIRTIPLEELKIEQGQTKPNGDWANTKTVTCKNLGKICMASLSLHAGPKSKMSLIYPPHFCVPRFTPLLTSLRVLPLDCTYGIHHRTRKQGQTDASHMINLSSHSCLNYPNVTADVCIQRV